MIQLIDVTKAFKNNVVLDGISMDFRDGELTVDSRQVLTGEVIDG